MRCILVGGFSAQSIPLATDTQQIDRVYNLRDVKRGGHVERSLMSGLFGDANSVLRNLRYNTQCRPFWQCLPLTRRWPIAWKILGKSALGFIQISSLWIDSYASGCLSIEFPVVCQVRRRLDPHGMSVLDHRGGRIDLGPIGPLRRLSRRRPAVLSRTARTLKFPWRALLRSQLYHLDSPRGSNASRADRPPAWMRGGLVQVGAQRCV